MKRAGPCRAHGCVPPALAALLLLSAAGDGRARALLRYDRAGLAAGQWWRLVTGHFVHLGAGHALLNLAGLGLLWALFARGWSARQWLTVLAGAIAAIDAGLWFAWPQVAWYVGASGWLHGVLAAGVAGWLRERRPAGWVLGGLLAGKLAWEQLHGALPLMPGGQVITQAHLCGAAGGVIAAIVLAMRGKPL